MFWMWIAALVGTATKYSECLLAVKYRVVAEDGHIIGGPFYYIENGMGKNWKWLAKIFAFMGVCVGLFGIVGCGNRFVRLRVRCAMPDMRPGVVRSGA